MTLRKLFGLEVNLKEELPEPAVIQDSNKLKGKISFIKESKGWGFILTPSIPFTRIFFHWTGLSNDTLHFTELRKGMKVEFETKEMDQGIRAIRIKVIENG